MIVQPIAQVGYGLVAAGIFVLAVVLHARVLLRRQPPVPHVLACWLAIGAAMTVLVGWVAPADALAFAVSNLAVYLFVGEVAIFVYAAAVGSLSIRILVTMRELESGRDAFARTMQRYPPDAFFKVRLQSLLLQGLLVEAGGRYRPTEKGRRWAATGGLFKRLLAVGPGG